MRSKRAKGWVLPLSLALWAPTVEAQDQDAPVMAPNASASYDSKADPTHDCLVHVTADPQAKVIHDTDTPASRLLAVNAALASSPSDQTRDLKQVDVTVAANDILRTSTSESGVVLQGTFVVSVTSELRLVPAAKKGQKTAILLLGNLTTDKKKLVAVHRVHAVPLSANESFALTDLARYLDTVPALQGKGLQVEIVATAPLIQTGELITRSEIRATYEIGSASKHALIETAVPATN